MSMRAVIEGIEREMFDEIAELGGDRCETNLHCDKINQCNKKCDISTTKELNKGFRRYVCGREDCEYKNKRNCGNCKWHEDGMCACLKRGITGFTDNDFCCECHELKG